MKILFIISTLGQGGAERVMSVLANELSLTHEIYILKFDDEAPFYELNQNIKLLSTKSGVGDKGFLGNITKRFDKILSLRKFLKNSDFDVVIPFLDNTNILTLIANFGLKNKIIVSEHTNHTFLKSFIWKALKRITYPLANGLTVLTKFDLDYYTFVKNREVLPNPMFKIPLVHEQNLQKENIILAAGRLMYFKGFDTFLNSLALIDKNLLSNWKIIIAGDGSEREKLQKLSIQLGLKVDFVGFVKNIEDYYKKAKIVAVTSRAEGFCNILMESIYFDCTRLSTNCVAGPSDLIKDGIDGFLCEVDNKEEIAKKLEILISDENLRTTFIKNANLRKDDYRVENIAKKWLEFIKICIQG